MLAYTFIIPFLSKLLDMSGSGVTSQDAVILSKIIGGYLTVKLSSSIMSELISKIIQRFRS